MFGFGVTLLEMMTGYRKHSSEQKNLLERVNSLILNERNLKTIMDVRMEGQYSFTAALPLAQIALKCLALDPKSRPSMKEVVEELEQIQAIEERLKQSENSTVPSSERLDLHAP